MTPLTRLAAALCLGLAAGAAQANDGAALRAALERAESRDYAAAAATARRAADPLVAELVTWRRLLRGDGSWAEMRRLLAERPGWAGRALIRKQAERAMPRGLPRAEVERFFAEAAPQTGLGAIRLAEAIGSEAPVARAWATLALTQGEREAIEARWGGIARAGAPARLDEMLWRGEAEQARALFPLVSPGRRALAEARLALRARRDGVDALVARVPAALADDPGLAYERFVWRSRAGRDASAEALLVERSASADRLGRPAEWARRRAGAARRAMRQGRARDAYRFASAHHLTEADGTRFTELEWLAGWAALRGLGDPGRAAGHFLRMWHAVETPISVGRAAYWLGRAYDAAGDARRSREWFARAADAPTSFYGQLAAEALGLDLAPRLAETRPLPDWRGAPFASGTADEAARLLRAAGQGTRTRWFLTTLGQAQETRGGFAAVGAFALELGRVDAAIRVAKAAAAKGHVLMDLYYPLSPLTAGAEAIEPALALAVARQESELNPEAVSPAGARGVMQLMPATAERVARDLGLGYARARLTADPAYNARLGGAYMARMLERYGGATILAAAAYNAGPHRVDAWLARFGDPRRGVDPIDWIESIPFRETRNYVQRVMEGLHVYRARLGARALPRPSASLLRRDG